MATKPPTNTSVSTTAQNAEQAVTDAAASAKASIDKGIATAREQAGPLADKARTFAKERPWATAALLTTVAAAVLGSLKRGKL